MEGSFNWPLASPVQPRPNTNTNIRQSGLEISHQRTDAGKVALFQLGRLPDHSRRPEQYEVCARFDFIFILGFPLGEEKFGPFVLFRAGLG